MMMAGNKKSLVDLFKGHYIQLTTKLVISSNDGEFSRTLPVIYSGYLINELDGFYILGDDTTIYSFCVRKDDVSAIEIVSKKTSVNHLIDEFERV